MTHHAALRLLALSLVVLGPFGFLQTIHASAFLDVNGVFTTFDAPGAAPGMTVALGINNLDQIVGAFTDSSGNVHGFVDTNGLFTTINAPAQIGVSQTIVEGINDASQIVGFFSNSAEGLSGAAFLYTNGVFTIDCCGLEYTDINNLGQITEIAAIENGLMWWVKY